MNTGVGSGGRKLELNVASGFKIRKWLSNFPMMIREPTNILPSTQFRGFPAVKLEGGGSQLGDRVYCRFLLLCRCMQGFEKANPLEGWHSNIVMWPRLDCGFVWCAFRACHARYRHSTFFICLVHALSPIVRLPNRLAGTRCPRCMSSTSYLQAFNAAICAVATW